ncbi:MAG: FGGY-family carbohydrate kinase [Christensenellales bacterium]|jgi:glycerol kinase
MSYKTILAIDQSTQSTKAALFDERLNLVSSHALAHRQYYPQNGWVEHDAQEIFDNLLKAAKGALDGADMSRLQAVAISNQRETVVFWDRETLLPCRKAIVWQDGRADEICKRIKGSEERVLELSGMPLSPLFSAAKIRWAIENDEAVKLLLEQKRLCVGTVDAYLVHRLTGSYACDVTNACRTQLMNIHNLSWDDELCGLFGIDKDILPEISFSDRVFGMTDIGGLLNRKIPLCGVVGDSQGAFFALGCHEKGLAKTSYGTGSSVMANVGRKAVISKSLAATVGIAAQGDVDYALEGNISHSADVVSWLCGEMELCPSPCETEDIAISAEGTGGVYIVPAFTGLGAPWFIPSARGIICGLNRATSRAHVVRAGLEAIAFQIADVLRAMEMEAGLSVRQLSADGGASVNGFLMQFQADVLGGDVYVAQQQNLSAMGAAMLAGIGTGIFKGKESAVSLAGEKHRYTASMDADERARLLDGWRKAIETAMFAARL